MYGTFTKYGNKKKKCLLSPVSLAYFPAKTITDY